MSVITIPGKDARDIILRPIISEKSVEMTQFNKYTFRVHRGSNKLEIRSAVQTIFKVDVLSVRTINVKGKPVRRGKFHGHKPDWKKAIVTLKAGQKIEMAGVGFFEA
ncbi:MAG TPA: 50S ribosomal protein L23 [Candidatus Xenobia bacterium]|jgi:large subunit ribosomal protein L23